MKRLRIASVLAVCALAISAAPVLAQGDISDPPALFQRTGSPFDTTPTADFEGVSSTLAQDHLFEIGWWFRVEGDPQESVIGAPDSQSYVGGQSVIVWNDLGARGLLSAREVSSVTNTGGPSGEVIQQMTLTNLTGASLDVHLFHFADIDLAGAGSDSATLRYANDYMQLTDPSANTAEYRGMNATAYLVRPFGATDVAAELSNASVTNFDNSGLPFGPADFTGGFQWTMTLPPNGAATVVVELAVNQTAFGGTDPYTSPFLVTGTLGSGSADWPSISGSQTGRLNRNSIASSCAVPKACNPFDATPGRAFDSYVFPNNLGRTACVQIDLNVLTQASCNVQANAYLDIYDPQSLCTGYLADPGVSSGTPPTPIGFSTEVPADRSLIVVVHTTNPGEIGCDYELLLSDDCIPSLFTDGFETGNSARWSSTAN